MERTASFGSISSGTMRAEDLIPSFAWELRHLRGSLPRDLANDIRKCESAWAKDQSYEFECEVLEELADALQDFAPAYAYFGAHPGDGSDYGYWLSESMQEDFDGLQVSDTSEVPKCFRGEVLHINDHGNMSLYVANSRGLREVWAIV